MDISHKLTSEKVVSLSKEYTKDRWGNGIYYKVGKIMIEKKFNKKNNEYVNDSGIYFYLNKERATSIDYIISSDYTGIFKSWYVNGQLKEETTYKDGKIDKLDRSWNENGQLRVECTYKDNKKDGLCKHWYDNGQLKEEYYV